MTVGLFDFFMDWNESDQHRSMKLVLDLVAQLLRQNPRRYDALATQKALLDSLVSIVTGRSTRPVAKSAIKTLDHFLSKGVFTLEEIRASYAHQRHAGTTDGGLETWMLLIADLARWMRLHFVCPTAGRLVVCLCRLWRREDQGPDLETWYQWLLESLTEDPSLLEAIKNYIFLPLFRADGAEGLRLLTMINDDAAVPNSKDLEHDTPALLRLAALETGKKVGLVEEPGE